MVIGLDFNGTLMSYDYPYSIGKDIGAVPVLKRLLAKGHEFVLMTSVSPNEVGPAKQRFAEMLAWFVENDIPYIGINENPRCNAITAKPRLDLIIDDHALGVPLIHDDTLSPRPYVGWKRIEKWFEDSGILDKQPIKK